MISERDVAFYREQGYLVVRDVLGRAEVEGLRRVTQQFVEDARARTTHDEVYDLEDSHSAREPRVRRIKTPHLWHEAYARMVAHPNILEVLKASGGPRSASTSASSTSRPRATARRSSGTRTGRSTRTPMTIWPRSGSCSTTSATTTAR